MWPPACSGCRQARSLGAALAPLPAENAIRRAPRTADMGGRAATSVRNESPHIGVF